MFWYKTHTQKHKVSILACKKICIVIFYVHYDLVKIVWIKENWKKKKTSLAN